ncbi:hypothetical protein C8039_02405 [Halogeometricum sp. wsp3]|nr:hypothetical protein C8039_02405 [Halogeometricum sp. wsp3]
MFVAAVLFLMTILLVFGLTTTDTLWLLQMMAYLVTGRNVGYGTREDQTQTTDDAVERLDRYEEPRRWGKPVEVWPSRPA